MNDTTLTILKNKQYLKNITVIGAVGNCLPRVFVMTATSTNGVNFKRFLEALAEKTRHLRRRPILVLDNHAAHRAKSTSRCWRSTSRWSSSRRTRAR